MEKRFILVAIIVFSIFLIAFVYRQFQATRTSTSLKQEVALQDTETTDINQDRQSSVVDPTKFGKKCKIWKTCKDLVGIECGIAADGDIFYVRNSTEEVISRCSGFAPTYGEGCPPEEWTCNSIN